MLADAIIGLVAKGVYLSAKHNVFSSADKEKYLYQLESIIGTDDITEAVQPLRFRYEFVNKFGEIRHGQMSQLIRATSDRAASDRVGRSEVLLLKDYSFTFRELSPLFEMLREARNYYAHNTEDREDIGWNGLIISAVTRILERGNFLDKKRVEERAQLRTKTTLLFNKLVKAQVDTETARSPATSTDSMRKEEEELIQDISPEVIELIEGLFSNQQILLSNSELVESQLSSIAQQLEALRLSSEASIIEIPPELTEDTSKSEIEVSENLTPTPVDAPTDDETLEDDLEEEPVLASETLISVDMLHEELQNLKGQIKTEYESDDRWRGPASNLLQPAIITTIVTNEPDNVHEILNYEDVKWRVRKEKELLNEQATKFGDLINELLKRTAWSGLTDKAFVTVLAQSMYSRFRAPVHDGGLNAIALRLLVLSAHLIRQARSDFFEAVAT